MMYDIFYLAKQPFILIVIHIIDNTWTAGNGATLYAEAEAVMVSILRVGGSPSG